MGSVSHSCLAWYAIAMCMMQIACTGDLPKAQPAKPTPGVIVPVHGRLPTSDAWAAALLMRIRPVVGMQPAECGRHSFKRTNDGSVAASTLELELSLKCGMTAARAKRSFWTFTGGVGIDSWIAEGLLGSPDGLIQHFSYDSSTSGNPWNDSKFRLTISPCPRPSVGSRNGRAWFFCVP
jgi:hypothetical protein